MPTKKATREKRRFRRPRPMPSIYEIDAVIAANIKSGMWQQLRRVTLHYARSLGQPGPQVLAESLSRILTTFEELHPTEADELRTSMRDWTDRQKLPPLTETIEELRWRSEAVTGRIH